MIVCKMPPKPARVSPLYIARLLTWATLEVLAGAAILGTALVLVVLCIIDVKVFP